MTKEFDDLAERYIEDTFGPSQCDGCRHYQGKGKCVAFPSGIPLEIITDEADHTQPYPGDRGVRFEPK